MFLCEITPSGLSKGGGCKQAQSWLKSTAVFAINYFNNTLFEVTTGPKKVAESKILGDLKVMSLKRQPKLATVGALRCQYRKIRIAEVLVHQASSSFPD